MIVRKEGGIAILAKENLQMKNVTVSNHPNILTALLSNKENRIRIVTIYGLQETCPAPERESLFDELSVEIENCLMHNDNPIITGDYNAKLEETGDEIKAISPNGQLLLEVVEKYSLKVLNFNLLCEGKWTRIITKQDIVEKSTIDYVITNEKMSSMLTRMQIDEEKLFTPFRITKNRGKTKQTFSDHTAIVANFTWKRCKEKKINMKSTKPGWKIDPEGLHKFEQLTNREVSPLPNTYQELERYIDSSMDNCFKRRKQLNTKKHSNQDHIQDKAHNETMKELKSLLNKGKVERKVAMEYISIIRKENLKAIQESRAERVSNILISIQNENGDFSPDKFWKLKKTITSNVEERTSIINEKNIEVFDTASILEEFKKEFKQRLSHREIHPALKKYEETTKRLLETLLEQSKGRNIADIADKETETAIKTLIRGKSGGPDMYPPDIFLSAGGELVSLITKMFNKIKDELEIPDSMFEVIVATIFKNKGSKKQTKYYRGVFLASVIYKIFEKIIKLRIKPSLEKIDLHQSGARSERSTSDSTFIINALKDHAIYLNKPLYLTFYDYSTCFDSLWLEDCMISLWNLGIQDRTFNLIYLLNEKCNMRVKTPHGMTDSFSCPQIVKQGTVLSGNLCTASTGELPKNVRHGGASINSVIIRTGLFVDDSILANTDVVDTSDSHDDFMLFTNRKRLGVNGPKCVNIVVNAWKGMTLPLLEVNGEIIQTKHTTDYLGDLVSDRMSNNKLISQKLCKGKAAMVSILALCNEVSFGTHYVTTGILLYKTVFMQSTLFNSESWTRLTQTDTDDLQTLQLKTLKRITHVADITTNSFMFLELGILPIKYELHKRKLIFLHHIINLDRVEDPVGKIFEQQDLFLPYERNWTNEVKELIRNYGLDTSNIQEITREKWKHIVTSKVSTKAFHDLTTECMSMKKTKNLEYTSFQPQEYIKSLPGFATTAILRIRSNTLPCKVNHKASFIDTTCRHCKQAREDQEHVINCFRVHGEEEWLSLQEYYKPNPKCDVDTLNRIIMRIKEFHDFNVTGDPEMEPPLI